MLICTVCRLQLLVRPKVTDYLLFLIATAHSLCVSFAFIYLWLLYLQGLHTLNSNWKQKKKDWCCMTSWTYCCYWQLPLHTYTDTILKSIPKRESFQTGPFVFWSLLMINTSQPPPEAGRSTTDQQSQSHFSVFHLICKTKESKHTDRMCTILN